MDGLVSYSSSSSGSTARTCASDDDPSTASSTPAPEANCQVGSSWERLDHEELQTDFQKRKSQPSGLPSALTLLEGDHSQLDVPQSSLIPRKRVRNFPHIEGNFATHVYITVPLSNRQQQGLALLLGKLKHLVGDDLEPTTSETAPSLEQPHPKDGGTLHFPVLSAYHVSLSHTVPIRYCTIQPLLASLRTRLKSTSSFLLDLSKLCVFLNGYRSRSFVALEAERGREQAVAAVQCVDAAFREHKLQPFHAEPRPHASLAWLPGEAAGKLAEAVQKLLDQPEVAQQLQELHWVTQVTEIFCRVGQKVNTVWAAKNDT